MTRFDDNDAAYRRRMQGQTPATVVTDDVEMHTADDTPYPVKKAKWIADCMRKNPKRTQKEIQADHVISFSNKRAPANYLAARARTEGVTVVDLSRAGLIVVACDCENQRTCGGWRLLWHPFVDVGRMSAIVTDGTGTVDVSADGGTPAIEGGCGQCRGSGYVPRPQSSGRVKCPDCRGVTRLHREDIRLSSPEFDHLTPTDRNNAINAVQAGEKISVCKCGGNACPGWHETAVDVRGHYETKITVRGDPD